MGCDQPGVGEYGGGAGVGRVMGVGTLLQWRCREQDGQGRPLEVVLSRGRGLPLSYRGVGPIAAV